MLGDVLIRRFKELENTTGRWGNNPFYKKIKDIAIEEIFKSPNGVKSDEIVAEYFEILRTKRDRLPEELKRKLNSNDQESFRVSVRNQLSSFEGPKHPLALANDKRIIVVKEKNRRGNRKIYYPNPIYLKEQKETILINDNGMTIEVPSPTMVTGSELIEMIEDFYNSYEIYKAEPLTDEQMEKMDKEAKIEFINTGGSRRAKTNASRAKRVLEKCNYKCEVDSSHLTFSTPKNVSYAEAHHLIPVKFQQDFENNNKALDVSFNIVCLCPNCHRAIHFGSPEIKRELITKLFNTKKDKLIEKGYINDTMTADDFTAKFYL